MYPDQNESFGVSLMKQFAYTAVISTGVFTGFCMAGVIVNKYQVQAKKNRTEKTD